MSKGRGSMSVGWFLSKFLRLYHIGLPFINCTTQSYSERKFYDRGNVVRRGVRTAMKTEVEAKGIQSTWLIEH